MTELLEFLVKALVEDPEAVEIEELEEDGDLIYEISVADGDLGRVIGKGGRVANAIRTIAKAGGGGGRPPAPRCGAPAGPPPRREARRLQPLPGGLRLAAHPALGPERAARRQRAEPL